MFKSLPRWLIPKAYRIRDKMKQAMQKWHDFARESYDWEDPKAEKEEWDEFYGARLMRERAKMFDSIDGFTDEAHAAIDLGMLWG